MYGNRSADRTLLERKLTNRNLPEQIGAQSDFRLGGGLDPFFAAGDLLLSTQLPLDGASPTPFHGFFTADLYLGVRVLDGLDVNLNLIVLNRTASGGFRVLSEVLPGLSVHLHLELGDVAGAPVAFDILTTDLDLVTLGEGTLIERVPLEGFMGGFGWRGFEARFLFAGRVFWDTDDVVHATATALDGQVGLTYTKWFTGFEGSGDLATGPTPDGDYVGAHARRELVEGLTVAGEYTARLGAEVTSAVLARADYQARLDRLALHVGYQFRFYETGFGPVDELTTLTWIGNTPAREEQYVTNSFEYLGLTPLYDQWSHTLMAEVELRLGLFELFAEGELWYRAFADVTATPARPIEIRTVGRAPGELFELFYRSGVRLFPFEEAPHRLVVFVGNKTVASAGRAIDPVILRYFVRPILFFEAEVYL